MSSFRENVNNNIVERSLILQLSIYLKEIKAAFQREIWCNLVRGKTVSCSTLLVAVSTLTWRVERKQSNLPLRISNVSKNVVARKEIFH